MNDPSLPSDSRGPRPSFQSALAANSFRLASVGLALAAVLIARQHLLETRAEQRRSNRAAEEQQARAYAAARRKDCYDIYVRERAQLRDVQDMAYDDVRDQCEVLYRHGGPKSTNLACLVVRGDTTPPFRDTSRVAFKFRGDCFDNIFRKSF